MAEKPRFSIVIPTRERCDVLQKSLQTVTSQDYDRLEIIVSDNDSRDQTREVVEAARDPRVTYVKTDRRRSMTGNWEFGLSHVSPGWVAILGDDDGVLPGALEKVAQLIMSSDVQAVRSVRSYYSWPSLLRHKNGRLRVPLGTGHEIRQSDEWLGRVMLGQASYVDLPMLYDGGFVHSSVIDTLRNRTGAVYRSIAPDIYSAIAIASLVDRYIFSHEVFAIAGTSAHSTGAALWAAGDKTDSPINMFTAEPNLPFHADVPLAPDGSYPRVNHAIVYEAYLQSADLRAVSHTTHAEQLEIILAFDKHRADAAEWGRRFADLHGLDFATAERRARQRRMRSKVEETSKRIRRSLNEIVVGSDDVPVRDVYEATIVAATVREVHPGTTARLRDVGRRVGRALKCAGR